MWNFHVLYFADVDFPKSTWILLKTKDTSKLLFFIVIWLFLIIFNVLKSYDVDFSCLYFTDVDFEISTWIFQRSTWIFKDPHGFSLKSQISKWWLFIIIWLVLIIFDVVESSDVDVFMFCTLLMWVFSWKIHIRTFYNIILIKNNRITINNHCFKVEMISGKSTWIFEHSLNIHVDIWKSTSAKYKTCKIHIRTFKNIKHAQKQSNNNEKQ